MIKNWIYQETERHRLYYKANECFLSSRRPQTDLADRIWLVCLEFDTWVRSVFPIPRVADRHQSVGQFVQGHTERMHNLDYLWFIYYLILNKVLFWKKWPDFVHRLCLWLIHVSAVSQSSAADDSRNNISRTAVTSKCICDGPGLPPYKDHDVPYVLRCLLTLVECFIQRLCHRVLFKSSTTHHSKHKNHKKKKNTEDLGAKHAARHHTFIKRKATGFIISCGRDISQCRGVWNDKQHI